MSFLCIILKFSIITILCGFCSSDKNVSILNIKSCKHLQVQSGYRYGQLFKIEDIQNHREDDEILKLKFHVVTTSNAHILLSPIPSPTQNDPVYEIVLGAGGNSFSVIRNRLMKSNLVTATGKIFSPSTLISIIIRQTQEGLLEVSIPGILPDPYLSFKDINRLHIKYIGFTTYDSIVAMWYYDCEDGSQESDQILVEEKILTDKERLEKDLFKTYDPFKVPKNVSDLKFNFNLRSIAFDTKKSIMTTRMEIRMNWTDPILRWSPDEYGNITGLRHPDYNIWMPVLMIKNGAGKSYTNFEPSFKASLSFTGKVEIVSHDAVLETWCAEQTSNWPFEIQICKILLGLKNPNLNLIHDNKSPVDTYPITQMFEWHLIKVNISQENVKLNDFEPIETDIIVKIQLGRNLSYYHNVLYTPLLVAIIMVLLSFELNGYIRGVLNLLGTLITCGIMPIVGLYCPVTNVPKLMVGYQTVLLVSCVSYMLHVVNRWVTEYDLDQKMPARLSRLTNWSPLRFILGIGFIDSNEYLQIQQYPLNDAFKVLNRLSFIIISFIFIYILIMAY